MRFTFTWQLCKQDTKKRYMDRLVLKDEIVEAIKKDQLLYGKVAYILDTSISSMPRILSANKPDLAQASVLRVIMEHLGIKKDTELLTELQEA